MATAPFPNIYTRRLVADSAAKSCDICYKSSTTVLITPEKQDFFYVCAIHLKDRNFCSPIVDEAAVEARKKRELDEEMERVKKEYEEKQKKKKEIAKEKETDKDKEKEGEEKGKEKKKDDKKDDKDDKDEKVTPAKTDGPATPTVDEEPRVFTLQRSFYSNRVDKKRQAEMARRNRERLQNPNLFPPVPKGFP